MVPAISESVASLCEIDQELHNKCSFAQRTTTAGRSLSRPLIGVSWTLAFPSHRLQALPSKHPFRLLLLHAHPCLCYCIHSITALPFFYSAVNAILSPLSLFPCSKRAQEAHLPVFQISQTICCSVRKAHKLRARCSIIGHNAMEHCIPNASHPTAKQFWCRVWGNGRNRSLFRRDTPGLKGLPQRGPRSQRRW